LLPIMFGSATKSGPSEMEYAMPLYNKYFILVLKIKMMMMMMMMMMITIMMIMIIVMMRSPYSEQSTAFWYEVY